METKFFTNRDGNTLIKKFEGLLEQKHNFHFFDALVGYFRASGYFKIRPLLNNIPKIRILVGINVDKLVSDAHRRGIMFFVQEEQTKEEYLKIIQQDIQEAEYSKETEDGILQFIEDIVSGKVQVRAHGSKKIHAKVYILKPENFNSHSYGVTITGSSNLTEPGLGTGDGHNYEFNVELRDYNEVLFASNEFELLWNESIDILPVDVLPVKKKTYLNDEVTPFQLYMKMLIEYFGNSIEYDPDSMGDIPSVYKKLSYQVDAVNEGYRMLEKHNGFFLADVVGLGKTIIAAMIVKKFAINNGKEHTKVLVVHPPSLEMGWKRTFKDFQLFGLARFVSNGSLHKVLDPNSDYPDIEDFDLIIVDEAHKFRNHTTEAYNKLQVVCKTPRRATGFVTGQHKKIILVSATPLNNHPKDLFYQLRMFQDARRSTLPVTNLTAFFNNAFERYDEIKRHEPLDKDSLRSLFEQIRKNILEPITIRRTRKDLENIPEYREDLEKQGIKFPKVEQPKKIEYTMNSKLNDLFYKTVSYLVDADKIGYYRYQAISNLNPELQAEFYENAERVSKSLAYIIKTQLVKRLESSFYAFKKSLTSFKIANDRMIKMFQDDKVFIAPDTDINALIDKGYTNEQIEIEIERLATNNPSNHTFKASDFIDGYLANLVLDSVLLTELVNEWNTINDDPKFELFILQLQNQFLNKNLNPGQKLVIFSESKDTITYLSNELAQQGYNNVITVSADNLNQQFETILSNFDANLPIEKQENNFGILLTTEVLSEGINLHRSNVIVHYDIPWNATKLMQRIGRVNRIGSQADIIHNFVFYPSDQGNEQIRLKKTALIKIQSFHSAFGEDNQIYSVDEVLDEVKLFTGGMKEEEDERLKYLHLLRRFRKNHPEEFKIIKTLPLKSRVGRKAKERPENTTITFLKSERKFDFIVSDDERTNELSPLEAFKLFEAKENEAAVPLISNHHTHVNNAIQHFDDIAINQENMLHSQVNLGGVALQARQIINSVLTAGELTDIESSLLFAMVDIIEDGRITNLQTEVKRLSRLKKNILSLKKELLLIAEKYYVQKISKSVQAEQLNEKPLLIISESFEKL